MLPRNDILEVFFACTWSKSFLLYVLPRSLVCWLRYSLKFTDPNILNGIYVLVLKEMEQVIHVHNIISSYIHD